MVERDPYINDLLKLKDDKDVRRYINDGKIKYILKKNYL